MSKHCNNILLRCNTAVLVFTLFGTVALLLIELTNALMTEVLVSNVAENKYRR